MKIIKVINKNTQDEVTPYYTNRKLRELRADEGEPLYCRFSDGGFFTHETVIGKDIELGPQFPYVIHLIETTRKIWHIQETDVDFWRLYNIIKTCNKKIKGEM